MVPSLVRSLKATACLGVLILAGGTHARGQSIPELTPATGSLAVKGTQGTADGATSEGDVVEVHLFSNDNQPVMQLDGVLDANGMALFDSIPITVPLRPIVRIMHDGVTYQEVGPLLSSSKPSASMDVRVFQTKLEEPTWEVVKRSVFANPTGDTVTVSEMLVVENLSDFTWLGGDLDEREQRTSVSFTLPENASGITLDSGFHGWCCTKLAGSLLEIQMPLMPGQSSYLFSYQIPTLEGASDLTIANPVTTQSMELLVPDNSVEVHSPDLTPVGMRASENGPLRVYSLEAKPANEPIVSTLAGLSVELPPMLQARTSNLTLRIVGGIALALLLAGVLYLAFARKPKRT
ncbi:MAG: hypothetical protein ACYTF7_00445 [Planctomycetota bacterium]|jgi:hypothetical protein